MSIMSCHHGEPFGGGGDSGTVPSLVNDSSVIRHNLRFPEEDTMLHTVSSYGIQGPFSRYLSSSGTQHRGPFSDCIGALGFRHRWENVPSIGKILVQL